MPRILSSQVLAELSKPNISLCFLFEGTFGGTALNIWSGFGPTQYADKFYLGEGWFLNFTAPNETEDLRADGFSISLTGASAELRAIMLEEAKQGEIGKIFWAFMAADGSILSAPYEFARGRYDFTEFQIDDQTCTLILNYTSDLDDLGRAASCRFTDQFQRSRYPDDAFFDQVATLQNKRVWWLGTAIIPGGK